MKPPKLPPAAFAEVTTISEAEALALLGQLDTSENRRALRQRLQTVGTDPACPRYYDADARALARTGHAPTASRSAALGVQMRRNG